MTRHYRPVDRHVIHRKVLDFRELCAAAVPRSTRFIVLDLDRTLHLARNMGEYMGWEMCAYHSYGAEHLDRVGATRSTARFLMHPRQPVASSRYFLRGCRAWAYPGLFYLLWGRMAGSLETSRRARHRLFGAEPYTFIQEVPTLALMHELAGVSVATASGLAERLLDRFAGDQVFDREDVAWLRSRCPGARIILSSASPRPTVEAAARALGIDDWECAEIEIHDAHYSSPFQLSPLFLRAPAPHRISPPSRYRVNAGRAKIERLLTRYPALADPATEVVGISDTWHGEDHCWAEHFTRVIDVNSTSPFPPLVIAESPLREIHSAQLLTRHERERRANGDPTYLDRRRTKRFALPSGGELNAADIASELSHLADRIETLAVAHKRMTAAHTGERVAYAEQIEAVLVELERAVNGHNATEPSRRRRHLHAINRLVRIHNRLVRRSAHSQRAASMLSLSMAQKLSAGRAALDRWCRRLSA